MNNQSLMKVIVMMLFTASCQLSFGQDQSDLNSLKNYRNSPVWIEMMGNPDANYYETIIAFREYWWDKKMPSEPFEDHATETFEIEVGLVTDKKSEEEREERLEDYQRPAGTPSYGAEVRAFKGWLVDSQMWLREDGSIISLQERQNIIEKQKQELEEAERLNKQKN
jgi:hypothetical protein